MPKLLSPEERLAKVKVAKLHARSKSKLGTIYFVQLECLEQFVKIGYTKHLDRKMLLMQNLPYKLTLLAYFPGYNWQSNAAREYLNDSMVEGTVEWFWQNGKGAGRHNVNWVMTAMQSMDLPNLRDDLVF